MTQLFPQYQDEMMMSAVRRWQQMMRRLRAILADVWFVARKLAAMSVREAKNWRRFDIPLQKRCSMWMKGFSSESLVIYRLESPGDALHFLSDFEMRRTCKVDGRYREILDDKLLFWLCLRNFSPHIVPVLAALEHGRIVYRSGDAPPDAEDLAELLRGLAVPVIIKPTRGRGGSNVQRLDRRNGVDYLNGAPVTRSALFGLLKSGTALIICPKVEQAEYARRIFSKATNTIRLLTMHDGEGTFLACGVHRFGTEKSKPVDNWGRGGLSVSIDPRTGTLGKGCVFPADGVQSRHRRHPDTGAEIEGVRIPNWEAIRDAIMGIAGALPFLPYVGWDVVPTDGGFAVLEGNGMSDVNLLQVHGPLLADRRTLAFYRRHGIVRRRVAVP